MRGFLRQFLRAGSLFCLFSVAAQGPAPAQPSGERIADREAIGAILRAQKSAWNHAAVDAFLQGYWHSPELTFSGSSGVARGWDGVRARYKKSYPDRAAMGQLNFSELEFRFLGPDAALVLENGTCSVKKTSSVVCSPWYGSVSLKDGKSSTTTPAQWFRQRQTRRPRQRISKISS